MVAANWWRYRSEAARTARADSRRSLGLIDGGDGRISKWLAKMIDLETGLSAFNVDQEERRISSDDGTIRARFFKIRREIRMIDPTSLHRVRFF